MATRSFSDEGSDELEPQFIVVERERRIKSIRAERYLAERLHVEADAERLRIEVKRPRLEAEAERDEEAVEEGTRPTPLLYNVTDTCYILGKISKQMLYRLINSDQLHPKKVGTRCMFTMEELERYVSTL
jgi:hypothetical protein